LGRIVGAESAPRHFARELFVVHPREAGKAVAQHRHQPDSARRVRHLLEAVEHQQVDHRFALHDGCIEME